MTNIEIFIDLVSRSQTILLTTHIYPDADGIGSQIALCLALRKMGKKAICVNQYNLPERYSYLDSDECVVDTKEFNKTKMMKDIDLAIITDTNSLMRVGVEVEKLVTRAENILFVDHHPCPKELSALHCINTKMAATAELVTLLINALGVSLNKDIALPLYTGIIIDTSSFRYPTVTANTHLVVSQLMQTGITPSYAYNMVYGTKKISHVRLLGKILSQSQTDRHEEIAWLTILEKDLKEYQVDAEDTNAFINHLLILDNVKVACTFREIKGGMIKISLRSTLDEIDVGVMAQALGGGGHNHSAATLIEGEIEKVVAMTIEKISKMLKTY